MNPPSDDEIREARNKIGNTYLDNADYRVRVTSIENWGSEERPLWIAMLRYDDGELTDQPITDLNDYTLLEFGDRPDYLTWVPENEAIDWAYTRGRLFAATIDDFLIVRNETDAQQMFENQITTATFEGRTYDELVSVFETSTVATETLIEACRGGFVDSILPSADRGERKPGV